MSKRVSNGKGKPSRNKSISGFMRKRREEGVRELRKQRDEMRPAMPIRLRPILKRVHNYFKRRNSVR